MYILYVYYTICGGVTFYMWFTCAILVYGNIEVWLYRSLGSACQTSGATDCIIPHMCGGMEPLYARCFSCAVGLMKYCGQCETCHLLGPVTLSCWLSSVILE